MEFTVASAPIGTKSIFGSLWRQSDVMILHEIADIFVMEEEQLLISLRELAENDAEWKTTIQEHGAVTVALDVGKTIFSLVFVPLPSLPFKAVNTASLLI